MHVLKKRQKGRKKASKEERKVKTRREGKKKETNIVSEISIHLERQFNN